MAKVQNSRINGKPEYVRAAPIFHEGDQKVRMLIVALDYARTGQPLTCTQDGRNMEAFATYCEVPRLEAMYDEQCTRKAVLEAIQQTCSRCQPDDYFVFFYAGHGTNVADTNGDEADGQDEAFVLVDGIGQVTADTLLVDDEFAEAICSSCHADVRILILVDCCHSGTVADLSRPCWAGRQAVSVAGCRDRQTSGDIGRGGIFTHSMLLANAKLSRVGHEDFSVGALYNATLLEASEVFHAAQDVTIQAVAGFSPDQMAWPLVPPPGYEAPLHTAAAGAGATDGVHPETLKYVKPNAVTNPISIEEYIAQVTAGSGDHKGLRICTARPMRSCYGPGACSIQ